MNAVSEALVLFGQMNTVPRRHDLAWSICMVMILVTSRIMSGGLREKKAPLRLHLRGKKCSIDGGSQRSWPLCQFRVAIPPLQNEPVFAAKHRQTQQQIQHFVFPQPPKPRRSSGANSPRRSQSSIDMHRCLRRGSLRLPRQLRKATKIVVDQNSDEKLQQHVLRKTGARCVCSELLRSTAEMDAFDLTWRIV